LRVVLLPIDVAAHPIQLTLDSRPLLRREFTAGLTRAGFIQLDLSLPPLESRRCERLVESAAAESIGVR